MKTVQVQAQKGFKVPMEGSRKTIGETPVTVPETVYYRRRIRTGELLKIIPEKVQK